MSPLNREVSLVVALPCLWLPPRVGWVVEMLGVRLHERPANDLDERDLRALNAAFDRCAASVHDDLEGVVRCLVRRFHLERMPRHFHCTLTGAR